MLAGCASSASVHPEPVIYGDDDRVEILDETDATARARGLASVVAVVSRDGFAACDTGPVAWSAPTLGASRGLCASERFYDEPVLARCSATLIDPELVLTARHCLADTEACREARFVPGLYLEEGRARPVTRDEIYACRSLVEVPGHDLVVAALDRPVAPRWEAAPIAEPLVGAPVHAIGFPSGLPMKSAGGCTVRAYYAPSDVYRIDCDLFAGSSGSGVFDANGALVGVYVQGAGDYVPRAPGECSVALTLTQEGLRPGSSGTPQLGGMQPVAPALEALCASERPTALCDRRARCGDGVCSAGERELGCDDCVPDRCGDGLCSPAEDLRCASDCGDPPSCALLDAGVRDAGVVDGGPPDAHVVDAAAAADGAAHLPAPAPTCAALVPAPRARLLGLWLIVVVAARLATSRGRPRRPHAAARARTPRSIVAATSLSATASA